MAGTKSNIPSKYRYSRWPALAFFIIISIGLGALSGYLSGSGTSPWYQSLSKPSYTPPGAVFGIVWPILYALMGWAYWRIWLEPQKSETRFAKNIFAAQFATNLGWSFTFFTFHQLNWAVIHLVVLLILIALTIRTFACISKWAALVLIPYFAWACFATVLSTQIWLLNG